MMFGWFAWEAAPMLSIFYLVTVGGEADVREWTYSYVVYPR